MAIDRQANAIHLAGEQAPQFAGGLIVRNEEPIVVRQRDQAPAKQPVDRACQGQSGLHDVRSARADRPYVGRPHLRATAAIEDAQTGHHATIARTLATPIYARQSPLRRGSRKTTQSPQRPGRDPCSFDGPESGGCAEGHRRRSSAAWCRKHLSRRNSPRPGFKPRAASKRKGSSRPCWVKHGPAA